MTRTEAKAAATRAAKAYQQARKIWRGLVDDCADTLEEATRADEDGEAAEAEALLKKFDRLNALTSEARRIADEALEETINAFKYWKALGMIEE